jgi:hypothetical protein
MATPTYDVASTSSQINQQNPSYTHTAGSGSNTVALILIGYQDSTPGTISSVTYGGVACTALQTELEGGDLTSNIFAALYIKKGVTAGGATVQVNFSETMNIVKITTITYHNVDQTTSTGTVATTANLSGTAQPSTDVTSAVGELVVDVMVSGPRTVTVHASQTERSNFGNDGNFTAATSEEAGAATVSMDWTIGGTSTGWRQIGVSLKPSVDTAVAPTVSDTATVTESTTMHMPINVKMEKLS